VRGIEFDLPSITLGRFAALTYDLVVVPAPMHPRSRAR
jgi:hypothetical protein